MPANAPATMFAAREKFGGKPSYLEQSQQLHTDRETLQPRTRIRLPREAPCRARPCGRLMRPFDPGLRRGRVDAWAEEGVATAGEVGDLRQRVAWQLWWSRLWDEVEEEDKESTREQESFEVARRQHAEAWVGSRGVVVEWWT